MRNPQSPDTENHAENFSPKKIFPGIRNHLPNTPDFIKKSLGEDVTMDTITEEQISTVINGTMSNAVGG